MDDCRQAFESWLRGKYVRHDEETLREWTTWDEGLGKYKLHFPQELFQAFQAGWAAHKSYAQAVGHL